MISDAVRDLYVARWGPPSRNARFLVDGLEAEVLKWNADANPEGVNLYATVGASTQPIVGRDPNHRLEFFLGLLPERDAVASPLAALALYSSREQVVIDHGDTVAAERALWPGTQMDRFLLLRPMSEVLFPLELPSGLHVEFLQAIPIFSSEAAYRAEHGAEALVSRWQESKVAFWDPDRSPEPPSR